jgi:hypothetical protein
MMFSGGRSLELILSMNDSTIVEAIIRELVNDGIIVKQQKESTPDDPVDKYEATQNLDKICKDFRDSGLSY